MTNELRNKKETKLKNEMLKGFENKQTGTASLGEKVRWKLRRKVRINVKKNGEKGVYKEVKLKKETLKG